jgi:PAS domain-containing protein
LVLVDITERKRAEEDRLIMNRLESTGILAGGIAHEQGRILEGNLTGTALLGVERSQLIGRRLPRYVTPASQPIFDAFTPATRWTPPKMASSVGRLFKPRTTIF